jgi:hypothetical protein
MCIEEILFPSLFLVHVRSESRPENRSSDRA